MKLATASVLFGIAAVCLFGATVATATPPALALKPISSGQLIAPICMANAGDGSKRLFVCDQVGQIRIIKDEMLLPTPFLDLAAKLMPLVATYDEVGVLGLAFHPDFANPIAPGYRKFYVFYSAPSPNAVGQSRISAISVANPCTITTTTAHALKPGDGVALTGVTGGTFSPTPPGINSTFTITVTDATHFTVPVDCSSTAGLSVSNGRVNPLAPVYCRSTISEFQVSAGDPNVADPNSERVLLAFDKPQDNHNGGALGFGPDGYLYISVGDGGSQHDNDYGHTDGHSISGSTSPTGNLGNAQDLTRLLGKILRIDPLGTNGPGGAYGIPASNHFVGVGGGVREEIFCFGMRNPWRFCFDTDPVAGARIIEADVGQDNVEEINLLVSGGNYGWRVREGTFAHDSTAPSGGGAFIDPVAEYADPNTNLTNYPGLTKIGISVIGGYVYRGSAIPGLVGQYVFGDYNTSTTATPGGVLLTLDSTNWTLTRPVVAASVPFFIMSFGADEDGELYVATEVAKGPRVNPTTGLPSGTIYKIVQAQTATITINPTKDNTIFFRPPIDPMNDETTKSNALGNIFAGETATGAFRRGLLSFDVTGNLPAGATISAAQLTLNMNFTAASAAANMSLFKVSQSWGEGTSGPAAGTGAPATVGDATWTARFYDPTSPTNWAVAGGPHSATVTATTSVGITNGFYSWSSAQLLTDVQGWLTTPASNLGWILIGDETTTQTARVFDSRESAAVRPALQLTYAYPPPLTWRETWLQQYFTPIGTFVSATADANGNGVNNLLEYAGTFNPVAVNTSSPVFLTSVTSNGGNTTYTMTFRRDPRAVDLTYQLQTSDDLVHWTTVAQSAAGGTPSGAAFVSEADAPGEAPVKIVTAVETLTSPAKHFGRLQIVRPQ